VVGTGVVMQLCKSVHQILPTSCRYTVSATLRIGCDWQVGSSVMGMLSCMELQLGYVVLQVALLTHPDIATDEMTLLLRNGLQEHCVFC